MQTASDTTRNSEIPVNNSIMTLQRMTYQEEKNSEFDVSNINTIPTRNPNVPNPKKNKKIAPNSSLKNDVDNSFKKIQPITYQEKKLSNLTSPTLTPLLPLPVICLPPKIIKK